MREIKYRQFVGGKWHYWGYLKEGDRVYFQSPVDRRPIVESYQYIGRKDRHGKEIYTGDIVKANYYAFGEGKDHQIKGEIIYDTEQFIRYRIGETRMSAATNFEVIGNLMENPELQ